MEQGVSKYNKLLSNFAAAAFIASASFSQAVHASFVSFDFTFDGASFGNTAQLTGTITFDDALLSPGGFFNYYYIGGPEILDLDVVVSGASSGNGHFSMSDFSFVTFSTNGSTLDPNTQLIGQPTAGLPWGTSSNSGVAGDFNLFGLGNAPYGTWWFQEQTSGGFGDLMQLTSMTPTSGTTVPIESWTDNTLDLVVGTNGFFGPAVTLKVNQSLSEHNLLIESNGRVTQTGGTHTVSGAMINNGSYRLSGGSLSATSESIGDTDGGQGNFGYGPSGNFTQNGGTNIVNGTLTLGKQAGASGTYNLIAGMLTAQQQVIGDAGTGTFNQSGGTNIVSGSLVLGQQAGSHGVYNLLDGVLIALNQIVGDAGEGVFTQGQNNYGYGSSTNPTNIVNGTLTLGKQANGVGTYNLLSGTLSAQQQVIGDAGTGTFNQSGGVNTVSGALILGQQAGSHGVYNLFDGVLSALNEVVGDAGEGTFTQGQNNYGYGSTNPTNSVNGTLTLGKQAGGVGTYNLLSGTLTAQKQVIGDAGTGVFNQSGGTNAVTGDLVLGQQAGSHGVYNLLDGVLVAMNEVVGDAGEGVFTQGQNNYGYGSSTNPTNSVNGTLTLGKQAGGVGTYNLLSGTLTAQKQVIGEAGTGTFNQSGGTNAVTGDLVLGQQAGSHGVYNLLDGVLVAMNQVIGDAGEGTFTQGQNNYGYGTSNPTNTVNGTLTLGKQAGGVGTYNLLSGALTAQKQVIGDAGTGVFNQTGGTNAVTGDLVLGQQAGSLGMYNLLDGALTALNEVVGDAGEGTITQGNNYGYGETKPTNTVTGTLTLGKQIGSSGTYNLISGTLTALHQVIGDAGTGVFNHTGGHNTVSGTLTVGKQAGSSGKYNLDGGELTTSEVVVGDAGVGTFTQTGGVHSLNNLTLGKQDTGVGSYVLKGGNLNVHGNINRGSGVSSVLISGGALNFDAGNHVVDVGTFELSNSGVVNLADNAITAFQGNVKHYGQEIHVGAGGNAIFNGEFEGASPITGLGTVTFNDVFKPGSGPITFTVAGDMTLGHSSTSMLEVAGSGRGDQYDALNVGGTLVLGGQLQLTSLSGFTAHLGDSFDLFDAEHLSGQFDLLILFALGDGLAWKVDYLTDAIGTTDVVRLSVVNAVPIPASIWLLNLPLLGLAAVARKRNRVH